MKRLFLTMVLILMTVVAFTQVTAVGEFRVANASTAWGVNLPKGTKIFNLATNEYWALTAASASTATLTSESNKVQLNGASTLNLSYDAPNHQIDITGGGTSATIPLADDDGATEGLASFTATDFDADVNGNVSIDYANGQAASGSQDGFLQSGDWTTFNNKLSSEVDGSITNEGSLTVEAGSATGSEIHSNTSGSVDVIIDGGTNEGIVITESGSTITIKADGTELYVVQTFEQTDDVADSFVLTYDPKTEANMTVSLNGYELKSDQFTTVFGGSPTITLSIPTYTYDRVSVSYTYEP